MLKMGKFPSGNRWHLILDYAAACGVQYRRPFGRIVKVESVWDKPVLGNTCLGCQQPIINELRERGDDPTSLLIRTIREDRGDKY